MAFVPLAHQKLKSDGVRVMARPATRTCHACPAPHVESILGSQADISNKIHQCILTLLSQMSYIDVSRKAALAGWLRYSSSRKPRIPPCIAWGSKVHTGTTEAPHLL